jgi:hypothetical protein
LTLPHPSRIRREALELRSLLDEHSKNAVPKLYRTVYHSAYDRLKTEQVATKPTPQWSDPAGGAAADGESRRKTAEVAAQKWDKAIADIRSAIQMWNDCLPDQRSLQTAPELDSAVGPGYVKAQREQQRKRQLNAEQGPMWSESSEVV